MGNIQAGGAGKTPLVSQIAREANSRGLVVCILTRGYGGAWEHTGGVISPDDRQPDPALCGDEAALIHDLVPDVWIGVGSDRIASFEQIKSQLQSRSGGKIDLVLLDDGFQHWKIKKDLEVVALTSATHRQTYYRDFYSALRFADVLIWTKGQVEPAWDQMHLKAGAIRLKVRFEIPIAPAGGQSYWLVSGVGDPHSVELSVREAGYSIARHLSFTDHAQYTGEHIEKILKEATDSKCKVLVTGKDWVKWRALGIQGDRVVVLEPKVVFEQGYEQWTQKLWG